jgi:type 1 glutamine amidotransferase
MSSSKASYSFSFGRLAVILAGILVSFSGEIVAPVSANASEEGASPTKVLVVTGVDYPGHKWRKTGPAIRDLLQKHSDIEARLVDDPGVLATELIFDYDTLVIHFKNYDPIFQQKKAQSNLTRFVDDGGGLVFFHFSCGAFEDWEAFVTVAGRTWDKEKRPHDPRGPFKVHYVDREHPITKGLKDFEITDELYTCLGGDVPIRVLATATSKVDQQDYPIAFVLRRGKGRVFHTVLGHDVKALESKGLAPLMHRACLWTADRLSAAD